MLLCTRYEGLKVQFVWLGLSLHPSRHRSPLNNSGDLGEADIVRTLQTVQYGILAGWLAESSSE